MEQMTQLHMLLGREHSFGIEVARERESHQVGIFALRCQRVHLLIRGCFSFSSARFPFSFPLLFQVIQTEFFTLLGDVPQLE